ncbi:MAG: phytanoyl-CoA dioxygenase family protein, partial [Chloroflexi bacterium]|nr:phytanoyl-CoA dioxygenase family protein [Chloroflexota bacterium]
PWHEDRHARLFVREAFSLSILLALEDSPTDNCTVFVPGSHPLTVSEKEDYYGITAARLAGGNVRYAGEIAARFREPLPLQAGETVLFHPGLLHASSGFVNRREPESSERTSITFRVTTPGVELRDAAFPEEREHRDLVLRTLRRASGTIG